MTTEFNKFIRTDEILAVTLDAGVYLDAMGTRIYCVAFQADDGRPFSDRFEFTDKDEYFINRHAEPELPKDAKRWQAFREATLLKKRDGKECIGKWVIITLDERGNPEDYRPPLVRQLYPMLSNATKP